MKTFSRTPVNIDNSQVKNYSKYFNQMNFKGISEDDNIYAIDQETFRDANNVYVNSDNKLVSRPTLQKDSLPSEINVYQYDLEDVRYIGQNTIYINKSKTGSSYLILLIDRDGEKHILQNKVDYTFMVNFNANVSATFTYKVSTDSLVINTETNCTIGTTGFSRNSYLVESSLNNEAWTIWWELKENKLTIDAYTYTGGVELGDKVYLEEVDLALKEYYISTIEHYIICWNNQGAKVFDTNATTKGWQNFSDFVEIPITKEITGSTITEYPKNEFTNQYKELYTYSNQSFPLLPSGTAEVEVFTKSSETLKYNMPKANEYTDYKIFKALKAPSTDLYYSLSSYNPISNKYILAVPTDSSVYVSLNGGITYSNILYPTYSGSLVGYGLSEDGLYYCFIAEDGVYFLKLADNTWEKDPLEVEYGAIISTCFKTREIYSYLALMSDNSVRLYFKGPSLYSGADSTKDNILTYIDKVRVEYGGTGRELVDLSTLVDINVNRIQNDRLKMFLTKNNDDEDIVVIGACLTKANNLDYLISVIGGKNMYDAAYSSPHSNEEMLTWAQTFSGYSHFSILDGKIATPKGDDWVYGFEYDLIVDKPQGSQHYWNIATVMIKVVTIETGDDSPGYKPLMSEEISFRTLPSVPSDSFDNDKHYYVTPQKLEQGLIYINRNGQVYFLPNGDTDWIHFNKISEILGQLVQFTVNHDKYFIRAYDRRTTDNYDTVLVTNLFDDDDLATLTYTYGSVSNYTKVPTVSYSDTELYLAFDNLLQITRNSRAKDDVTKINFNLPDSNNQSFIDNITAIINISTTEVALFFLNRIIICSKVQDVNLAQGFRYDYYNTKLSTGVRLGDVVMNTLEGQYTIFPTKRGLAIMNYQAFMATTDQVIEYISDNIRALWDEFYSSNNIIKIIQWNNKLILTNNTTTILLYDLTRNAWWKWEVPIVIKKAVTDHIDLRIIDNNLNIFKDATQYYDFGEIGNFKEINWFLMSQPLHLSAPTHYKNMKQLVFQFAETDDNIVTKTMNAQIKLYRKKLSVKEPETIKFQIENLRTFVKRFNYWKINEIQWALGNDTDTNVPKQFELNAVSIKYEIGDEVR